MLNAVICGGTEKEAWLHWRAYDGVDNARVLGVYSEGGGGADARAAAWDLTAFDSFKSVISDPAVQIVELLDPMPGRASAALAALDAGKHVLLGTPFAAGAEQAQRLAAAARRAGRTVMCYENWMFYPPLKKILKLVEKKTVGRVTGVRMRTIMGGRGGWDTYLNPTYKPADQTAHAAPDHPSVMFRETYEKLSLALRLFGPIDELHFASPGVFDTACACVLTWKHKAHGTYGALEIVTAPDMHIRSAYDPRDDTMELAGSAGIIWLTHSAAQIHLQPAVRAIRGENQFSYGNIEDDWLAGYTYCAQHFADCAAHHRAPLVNPSHSAAAVSAAQAAARSAETGQRVKLS